MQSGICSDTLGDECRTDADERYLGKPFLIQWHFVHEMIANLMFFVFQLNFIGFWKIYRRPHHALNFQFRKIIISIFLCDFWLVFPTIMTLKEIGITSSRKPGSTQYLLTVNMIGSAQYLLVSTMLLWFASFLKDDVLREAQYARRQPDAPLYNKHVKDAVDDGTQHEDTEKANEDSQP